MNTARRCAVGWTVLIAGLIATPAASLTLHAADVAAVPAARPAAIPQAQAAELEKYLQPNTDVAIHLDLSQAKLDQILEWFSKQVQAAGLSQEQATQMLATARASAVSVDPMVQAAAKAGATDAYGIVSFSASEQEPPFVIIPPAPKMNADEVARALNNFAKTDAVTAVVSGGTVLVGSPAVVNKLKANPPAARGKANLLAALAQRGNAAATVALDGSLLETFLVKDPQKDKGAVLWALLSVSVPPRESITFQVQAKDAAAAQIVAGKLNEFLEQMKADAQLKEAFGDPAKLFAALQPRVDQSNVTVSLDAKTIQSIVIPAIAKAQAADVSQKPAPLAAAPADAIEQAADAFREGKIARSFELYDRAVAASPQDAHVYAARGWAYVCAKLLPRGIDDLSRAIALDPNHAEFYAMRGRAFALVGDNKQALADFDQALKRTPDDAHLRHDRASCRIALGGQEAAAIEDLNVAIRLEPNDVTHQLLRGNALGALHKTPEAMADFDAAVKARPKDPAVLMARAGAALRFAHQPDAAIRDLQQARPLLHPPTAILERLLAEAYRAKRDDVRAALHEAEAKLIDGDNAGALAAFSALLGSGPGAAPGSKPPKDVLFAGNMGVGRAHRNLAEAIPQPSELDVPPERRTHFIHSADAFISAGEADPSNALALAEEGWTYYCRDDLTSYARNRVEAAVKADPKLAIAHYYLGVMYKRDLKWNLQRKDVVRVDGLPTKPLEHGTVQDALRELNTAIALDPSISEAYAYLGDVYTMDNNDAAALAQYNKTIANDPANTHALINRGLAYMRMNDFPRALRDADLAVKSMPNDARPYWFRARILRAANREEEARQDYQRAFTLNPTWKDPTWKTPGPDQSNLSPGEKLVAGVGTLFVGLIVLDQLTASNHSHAHATPRNGKTDTCGSCFGQGRITCSSCAGIGRIYSMFTKGSDMCSRCGGSGRMTCQSCDGSGFVDR
jgi:tetratricopeptide (TPR) repeat protein